MLRKIAVKAASKPLVEITQDGETLSIKTSTSVRTTHITFTVGQEFNESTVDGRPCTVRWGRENIPTDRVADGRQLSALRQSV